ncbi:nectin-4 [Limanda limanda]|uniref:nectin-4 n=1 Tax=Limanda limanda TaxID=27771 RepID=UPI0029C6BBEF|nr:nectin-4 [Limanda limanda]
MTPLLNTPSLCLLVLRIFVTQGVFVEEPPKKAIHSLAEKETVLPCRYTPIDPGTTVVQVTWYKEKPGAGKDQIITAHFTNGQTAFGSWSRKVHFRSSEPTLDSSLVFRSTEVSDEGKYICHINTFPSGNFDSYMSLTVWTIPISSLEPVIMVEGQSYGQAASCRSIARPPPRLSWESALNGQSTNRTSENGAVTSHYSLHPLRSMNGMKLDCLVWHPTSPKPRRLRNILEVHFPPHAEVSGYSGDWFIGLESAALRCVSGGNPKPRITWIRVGKDLPEGVIPHPNGTLVFGRPLSLSDQGTYQCVAENEVSAGKAEVDIVVAESRVDPKIPEELLMIIVGAVAGGLLLLMLVIVITITCHHKRKSTKLKKELNEKTEEISTLSRHASIRRMHSVSTDTRGATEENIPLRVEGTMRTSFSSLGDQGHYLDSRSSISGGRAGGGGAYDYLGRPVLHNNSRRGRDRLLDRDEENRLRVETYVRDSTISLQETRFHPPLTPTTFPMVQSTETVRQLNGSTVMPADGGGSRPGSATSKTHQHPPLSSTYPPVTDDEDEVDEGLGGPASQEHPDDQDSETNSSHVSEVPSPRYQHTNGTLRPKPRPSPTVISPHASMIHKAQIV